MASAPARSAAHGLTVRVPHLPLCSRPLRPIGLLSFLCSCFLGENVAPLLALVSEPSEAPVTAPPALPRPVSLAPCRARLVALAAGGAALVALAFWWPSRGPGEQARQVGSQWSAEIAVDGTYFTSGGAYGPKLSATIPDEWKRKPCERSQREVYGACFVVLEQRPPCSDGYEHDGRCLMPIATAPRVPSSINTAPL